MMKYRLFSVLIILAMVASLCAVAVVAPASADVSAATVTVANNKANQTSAYTIQTVVGAAGALAADTDDIILTFPAGTTLPSSMDWHNVLVGTPGGTAVNVGTGGVDVAGQTVTVNMPIAVANSGTVTVTITQGEGIVNPQLSLEPAGGTEPLDDGYQIAISTSQETTAVLSTEYYIYNWITISPAEVAMGDPMVVTGAGFTPESDIILAQAMGAAGSGTVGSDGTFSIDGFATGTTNICGGNPCPVVATDGEGRTASAAISTVLPRLVVTPTSGNIGSTAILRGYDFTGTASGIATTIAGTNIAGAPTWIDNDHDSTVDDFVLSVTIPVGITGGQKVIRVVNLGATGSPTASANFTVADHAITVSPASGPANSTVTVTGAGWPPSDDGTGGGMILFAYSAGLQSPIDDGTVATDGTGAFTESVIIPADAQPGLTAIACAFGTSSAIAYFTVAANALTISPTSGPKGTMVTISGGGMTHSTDTVTYTAAMTLGGDAWGSAANLDTQGNLTPSTIAVPTTAAEGINSIRATDNSVNALTATGTFEVLKPTLQLDVTEAVRGQIVTVTGANWYTGPGAMVTISANLGTTPVDYVTPDANGNIYSQFQVATDVGSDVTVSYSAIDSKLNATMPVSLKVPAAMVAIDPASGVVGSTATVSGTGFSPLTPIETLTLGSVNMIASLSTLTDAHGSFEATITIPGLSARGYAVSAKAGNTASTSFTVVGSAAAAATPAVGFATISDCMVIAWAFDGPTQAWLVYDPTEGATSTLDSLVTGQGYWIEVAEDCTLTYGSKTYTLTAGWNLIGWLG